MRGGGVLMPVHIVFMYSLVSFCILYVLKLLELAKKCCNENVMMVYMNDKITNLVLFMLDTAFINQY